MKLPDSHIRQLAKEKGMIDPFIEGSQGKKNTLGTGLSSYGYDISLSSEEFYIIKDVPGRIVDPKDFKEDNLEPIKLNEGQNGLYFIMPPFSYARGVSVERLAIPRDVFVQSFNKSTYARSAIGVNNMSPVEPGWRGYLTLEIANCGPSATAIYAHEGICQLVFDKSTPCESSYEDRKGKYQDQKKEVSLSRVSK